MEIKKLHKIKQSLEDFFYKIRLNIGLHKALHSEPFYQFRDEVKAALLRQILSYAKIEKVNQIIGLQKAVKDSKEYEFVQNLRQNWIPILGILGEAEIVTYLTWSANKGGQTALDKLKSNETFNLTDSSLLKNISSRTSKLVDMLDSTTESWIARTIEQGIRDNLSTFEIAKLLRDDAQRVAEVRSDSVAEFEAASMMGQFEKEVYIRNGIEKYSWVTSHDELVCPDCVSNEEAGAVPVGAIFPSGSMTTPEHQACRCFVLPEIPDNLEITWAG